MTDRMVLTLLVSGLIVQGAAVGIGFTSLGWRWPLIGAGVLVSLGCILGVVLDGGRMDGPAVGVLAFSALVLGLAAGHGFSTHPVLVWSLRIGVGVQALGMALLLAFLLTFKMSRLF